MIRRLFFLLFLLGSAATAQFPPSIKNVVIIFQENRTPDNLFHFLTPQCPLGPGPGGEYACTPASVTTSCYNISPCGLSNMSGTQVPVTLTPRALAGSIDPDHSHNGFYNMCDPDPATFVCRNDGAWKTSQPAGSSYAYVANPPVTNYDGSGGHLLDPYLTLAKQYGWANYMYQTNQGPSYPAHQFIFSGTSAATADDDARSIFVAENFDKKTISNTAGCLATATTTNALVSPALDTPPAGCNVFDNGSVKECPVSNTALNYPTQPIGTFCYPHESMASLLEPRGITWKYYAPSPGSIWTAPDSFYDICKPQFAQPNGDPRSELVCTGRLWKDHVDLNNHGADILSDIASCSLSRVSWVIPDGAWSDHAGIHDEYGPSWVAALVNAIGTNRRCPAGTPDADETYWQDTAIVITWDDWGGWSDHEPARYLSRLPCNSPACAGDYQLGFRVPLLVVSAYTPIGFISNDQFDFGSVLRMIEGVNHVPEGELGFADIRSTTDLHTFFPLADPRDYVAIPAVKDAHFFLTYSAKPIDPDDD